MKKSSNLSILLKGIIKENPVFVLILGGWFWMRAALKKVVVQGG